MDCTSSLLLLLAVIASANAFYTLVPEGKELVYEYNAIVRSGTHLPTYFVSAFEIEGKLHVQTDKNSTFMRLSDLKYDLFNGKMDPWHDYEAKELSLPTELEALQKTFQIVYDVSGRAMGIATEDKEAEYIVNMKRAIGSLMQLDMESVNLDLKKPHAFHNEEFTIYGKGKTYYNVMPKKDYYLVEKMEEPHSTFHMYTHAIINQNIGLCEKPYDEPLTRDSVKTYKIMPKDKDLVVDSIEATSGIYFHPLQGESEAHHIYLNQTMNLLSMNAITTKLELSTPKFQTGLTYFVADMTDMSSENFLDLTNGRRHWDMNKLITEVEGMLHDIIEYMKHDHLNDEKPNIEKGQLISRLKRLMLYMDLATLDKLHTNLLQKTEEQDNYYIKVYYQMLPLIGTRAAMLQILNLVKEKRLTRTYIMLLQEMPMHVKTPNKKLIEDMEELINLGDEYPLNVQKAAILSFGSLVHKAINKHKSLNYEHMWSGHEHHEHRSYTPDLHLDEYFPDEKYYEKYVTEFGKRLNEAKDYEWKLIYIEALHNTKMDSALKYLLPIVKGELFDDKLLRMIAALSVSPMVLKNEDLTYEIYWPIMTNVKLSTSLRVIAYEMIMRSIPSQQRIINMYWQMNDEKNSALYQFHYKYMRTMSETLDPCKQEFKLHLKQVLRYTQEPEFFGMTGYYNMDYVDEKYGFGEGLTLKLVHTPFETDKLFRITYNNFMSGMVKHPYSLIIRIDGLEGTVFDNLKLDLTNPTRLFTYDKLFKIYSNILNNKNIKIYVGVLKFSQVVMSYYFDSNNIKELEETYKFWYDEAFGSVEKMVRIHYPMSKTVILPTEIGFPALYQLYLPSLHYFNWDIKKETVNNLITYHFDTRMKIWSHGRVGLSFYNPFADLWQGINKYNSFDMTKSLYFDVSFNPQQHSMKLSWKRHEKPEDDVSGFRSHVTTMVFMKDDLNNGNLKKSCANCNEFEIVTLGAEHRHEHVLHEEDNSNTGFRSVFVSYDSERYLANSSWNQWRHNLDWESSENACTMLGHYILNVMHRKNYLYIQPAIGTNGFLMRTEPSKEFPVTNIDMSFRLNTEYKHGEMIMLPGMKYNMRATYSIKNKEKTMKTWDLSAIFDTNIGHTTDSMKWQLSRTIPGQKDFKICTDGAVNWANDKVEATVTAAFSQSGDPKCTKEENILEMKVIGEKSTEQNENKHVYGNCYEDVWSDMHNQKTMKCYEDYSSLRRFIYDIKTHNLPSEFVRNMKGWLDWMKFRYIPYLSSRDNHDLKLEENEMKIYVEYPMIGGVADVHLHTPEFNYVFTGIPFKHWPLYRCHLLNNLQYNRLFRFMNLVGLTKTCFVDRESLHNMRDVEIPFHLTSEYTMYLGDAEADSKHGLWARKMDKEKDSMAIKILHGTKSLEIIPNGDKYDILVDGTKMGDDVNTHSEDWLYYYYSKMHPDVVIIISHHLGAHYIYDGHHVQVEMPNADMQMYGHCFDQK